MRSGDPNRRHLIFDAPLTNSIGAYNATLAFTRATAAYVRDHEGVHRLCRAGEIRFTGARRVENLVSLSRMSSWDVSTSTKIDGQLSWDGTNTASKLIPNNAQSLNLSDGNGALAVANGTASIGSVILVSFYAKAGEFPGIRIRESISTGRRATYDLRTGAVAYESGASAANFLLQATPVGGGWFRVWVRYTTTSATIGFTVKPSGLTDVGDGVSGVFLADAMWQEVTGQADITSVSEFVSKGVLSSPFQGASVDGVAYLTTTLAGVAIPATTLLGYLREPAATQLVTPTASIRDLTHAAWVKTTMTTARTSTGPDAIPNSATRCTASATNGLCRQTLVAAASTRIFSCWMRRVTGVGAVELTQDGVGFTNIAAQLNSVTYTLVQLSASVLDAGFGFRIVTNGDAVDVDFTQFEAPFGAAVLGATSPMVVTGAARNPDVLQATGIAAGALSTLGSVYCEPTTEASTGLDRSVLSAGAGVLMTLDSSSQPYSYDGTTFANALFALTARLPTKCAASWGGATFGIKSTGDAGAGLDKVFDGNMGGGTVLTFAPDGFAGNIRNVRVFGIKLTNDQLTAMVA